MKTNKAPETNSEKQNANTLEENKLREMNQAFMRDHEAMRQRKINNWLLGIIVLLLMVVGAQLYLFSQKSGESSALPDSTGAFSGPSIQNWDPFQHFQNIQKQMDHFFAQGLPAFDSSFPNLKSFSFGGAFSQKFDLNDQDGQYVVTLKVPGLDQKNLTVSVEEQSLKVSGEMQMEDNATKGQGSIRTYRSQHFERYMTYPGPVKPETLKVEYESDLLKVTIDKDNS